MTYVMTFLVVVGLLASPVAAGSAERSPARAKAPGTVYSVHHEQGRVHVMDHQERIFVVPIKDPILRCRNRRIPCERLRPGDKVWFAPLVNRPQSE